MNSTLNEDYFKDLEDLMRCCMCLKLPPGTINFCNTGHLVCGKCKIKYSVCSLCKLPVAETRAFVVELLIPKFLAMRALHRVMQERAGNTTASNSVQMNGCGMIIKDGKPVDTVLEMDRRLLDCLPMPLGLYCCLMEPCPQRQIWSVPELHKHLESAHKQLYQVIANRHRTFIHVFDGYCLKGAGELTLTRAFHVSNMGLFYLRLMVSDDKYIRCWVSMAANVKVASQFVYRITFTRKQDNSTHHFKNTVTGTLQDTYWLMSRSRIFLLSPEYHNLTDSDSDTFSLKVNIVYKPPQPNSV